MLDRPRLWLCLPIVASCMLDLVVTLAGQSRAYWAGDRLAAVDGNPIARMCLQAHPLVLVGFAGLTTAVLCAILGLVPLRLAAAFAFIPAFMHALAAAGWLVTYGTLGWVGAVCVLAAAERLVHWSWLRANLGRP